MRIPLFDIDWTLLDKGGQGRNIHREAFLKAYKEVYDIENPRDIEVEGKIDNQIVLETVVFNGIDEDIAKKKLPSAIEVMRQYFAEHKGEGILNPLPGVREILEDLHQKNILRGLLTGNVGEIAWGKLEVAGIKKFFEFGAFGDEALKRVDLIEIARIHAEEISGKEVATTDLVIIGDTPLDVACAKAGGIECIAVATGMFSEKELLESGADIVIPSLLEKERVIDFLKSAS